MTVAENVAYGLVTRKVPKEARDARVKAVLAMLGLGGLEERHPGELSGGQQQRVAVARAVVVEPDVLLMDEPLSNLDAALRAEMRRELKALVRRLGVTTIYVTHDQREALSMADRVAVMRDGRVVQCAGPRWLYDAPEAEFVATFVGEANRLRGRVVSAGEDGVEVKTDAGRIAAAAVEGLSRGDEVEVVVRPEDLRIGAAKSRENALEGRVADVAFFGGAEEVLVELAGGARVRVVRRSREGEAKEGEDVELAFAPNAARVFRRPGEEDE
jgi:ABC-type Fe3+/spermidine/putrescine transport system ATPase subunit